MKTETEQTEQTKQTEQIKKGFRRSEKGFSLVELLIVVAIIGILASIGIPAYQNYQENAKNGAVVATLDAARSAYGPCLAVKSYADCDTKDKLKISLTSKKLVMSSTAADKKVCFLVVSGPDTEKRSGCVGFEDGEVKKLSTAEDIAGLTAAATCIAGACTPGVAP